MANKVTRNTECIDDQKQRFILQAFFLIVLTIMISASYITNYISRKKHNTSQISLEAHTKDNLEPNYLSHNTNLADTLDKQDQR